MAFGDNQFGASKEQIAFIEARFEAQPASHSNLRSFADFHAPTQKQLAAQRTRVAAVASGRDLFRNRNLQSLVDGLPDLGFEVTVPNERLGQDVC